MPKLIVFPGAEDQYELDLTTREAVSLGRDPSSDVVVERRMASRHHARIERRGSRYYVRDTESYNSTFVNNRPVHEAELIHGDEIRIADRLLRFIEFNGREGRDDIEARDTLSVPHTAPPDHDLHDLSAALDGIETPPSLPAPATAAPVRDAARPATGAARVAPRPPAPRPLLTRRQIVLALVALLLVVLGGLRLYLRLRSTPPGGEAHSAPRRTAVTPDYAALSAALEASGEDRIERLWKFIYEYPDSSHRELAYLRLLEAGASDVAVCDYAQREDAALFAQGSALSFRCSTR